MKGRRIGTELTLNDLQGLRCQENLLTPEMAKLKGHRTCGAYFPKKTGPCPNARHHGKSDM